MPRKISTHFFIVSRRRFWPNASNAAAASFVRQRSFQSHQATEYRGEVAGQRPGCGTGRAIQKFTYRVRQFRCGLPRLNQHLIEAGLDSQRLELHGGRFYFPAKLENGGTLVSARERTLGGLFREQPSLRRLRPKFRNFYFERISSGWSAAGVYEPKYDAENCSDCDGALKPDAPRPDSLMQN
jgi:hypothetical protein